MNLPSSSVRAIRMLLVAAWTTFVASLGLHVVICALNYIAGCPGQENQSSVFGELSAFPPGVTCTYEMEAGTLVIGDEWWAPAIIVGSSVTAVVLTGVLAPGRRPADPRG